MTESVAVRTEPLAARARPSESLPLAAAWVLTGLAAPALWGAGAWPGLLEGVLSHLFVRLWVVAAVAVLLVLLALARPRLHVLVILVTWGATLALIGGSVPARVGFALSRAAFERRIEVGDPEGSEREWLGLYRADVWEGGAGGTYFEVHTYTRSRWLDFLPPLICSGFVHRPGPEELMGLELTPIAEDWYLYRYEFAEWD